MFQVDNVLDSSQDDDVDLPPPPPPSQPPPMSTPSKINYLTAVTPKPYKSPLSLSNSSTPIPPPPETIKLRDSPISSVTLSLNRPRSFDLDSKADNRRSLASQIANFALSESNSDLKTVSKETRSLPWLNNSQGTSPLERSSSSESENVGEDESSLICDGDETKQSNWSLAEEHADRLVLGSAGFSMRSGEEHVKKIGSSDNDGDGTAESGQPNTYGVNQKKLGTQSEKGVKAAKEKNHTPLLNCPISNCRDQRSGILHNVRDP